MDVVTGIAVYVIVWWVVLFAILPWGVRPDESAIPGAMAGAPERPRLWLKIAVTTGVAGLAWLLIAAAVAYNWFPLRPPGG